MYVLRPPFTHTFFFSSVNSAFITLRQLIPTDPIHRKLSKIETLRLAKSYIGHLESILLTGIAKALTARRS